MNQPGVWLFMDRYFKVLFRGGREGAASLRAPPALLGGRWASPRGERGPAPAPRDSEPPVCDLRWLLQVGRTCLKGKLLVGDLSVLQSAGYQSTVPSWVFC